MLTVNTEFLKQMKLSEAFDATACINCGTCTALCPMEIGLLPRKLFRYVMMGLEDKLLENTENIYSCLLCRMCEDNCPAGVHITGNVRALRSYINENVYRI